MKPRPLSGPSPLVARALGAFRLSRYLTRHQLRILGHQGFSVGDEYRSILGMFMRAETFKRRMTTFERVGLPVISLDEAIDKIESQSDQERRTRDYVG